MKLLRKLFLKFKQEKFNSHNETDANAANSTPGDNCIIQNEGPIKKDADIREATLTPAETDLWWFLPHNKAKSGPFTLDELKQAYFNENNINQLSIRINGNSNWVKWVNAKSVFPSLSDFFDEVTKGKSNDNSPSDHRHILGDTNKIQAKLMKAIHEGNIEIVKALIERGANPNSAGYDESTPLLSASINGNADIVKLLIEHGADPNATNKQGSAALDWASEKDGNTEIIELLIRKGANPNATNNFGSTALKWAVHESCTKNVKLLLEKGADPNIADKHGFTTLMEAAKAGNTEIVYESIKLLLEKGADPNIADPNGFTALMFAVRRSCTEKVKLLLEKGADPNIANMHGETALTMAAKAGNAEMIKLFEEPDLPKLFVSTPTTGRFVDASLIQCHVNLIEEQIPDDDFITMCARQGKTDGVVHVLERNFIKLTNDIIPGFDLLRDYTHQIESVDSMGNAISKLSEEINSTKYDLICFPCKLQIDQEYFSLCIALVIETTASGQKHVICIEDGAVAKTLHQTIKIRS